MPVSSLALERRIAAIEKRLPVQFAWSQGQGQPGVDTHGFVFWEDTLNGRAKLLMRRGARVYVFESHEASDAPPTITPAVNTPTTVGSAAGAVGAVTDRYALEDHRHQLVTPGNVLATPIRHLISVVTKDGVAKTGAAITSELVYDDGTFHSPAPESVVITELGGGDYRVVYTPTVKGAVYRLRLASSGNIVTPSEFQDTVWSA